MHPSPLDAFTHVRTTRAHELIVEQLEQLILSGALPAGSHLPSEREMMARFAVSRPTVREALRVAESLGLIAIRPGDPAGPRVLGAPGQGIGRLLSSLARAGGTSTLELIELRLLIESSAAALAASAGDAAGWEELESVLLAMRQAEPVEAFAALDLAFHGSLVAASGNRLFLLVFDSLLGPIQNQIQSRIEALSAGERQQILEHHTEILEALQASDGLRAARAVRNHLCAFYLPVLDNADKARLSGFVAAQRGLY